MPSVYAILNSENVIVNRHVVDSDTFPDDWTPGLGLTHYPTPQPDGEKWAIGGTLIDGVYTPPPGEPNEDG